jgi:hypothetical protein
MPISCEKYSQEQFYVFKSEISPVGFASKTKAYMRHSYQRRLIMARTKPYTGGLLVLDLILTLITGGIWLVVVLFREMWRRN